MEIQEIEITIDKKGQVVVHVRGVNGAACLDLTHDLETALGSQVIDRQMTPDAGKSSDLPTGLSIEIHPGK